MTQEQKPEKKRSFAKTAAVVGAFALSNILVWNIATDRESAKYVAERKEFTEQQTLTAKKDELISKQGELIASYEEVMALTETKNELEIKKTIQEGILQTSLVVTPDKDGYIRMGQIAETTYECVGSLALDKQTGILVAVDEQCATGTAESTPSATPQENENIELLKNQPAVTISAL